MSYRYHLNPYILGVTFKGGFGVEVFGDFDRVCKKREEMPESIEDLI